MSTKRAQFPAEFKTIGDKGKVEAIVSVFGNVDRIGDRVMPGAFKKTIAAWKESGDPVPVILSHSWDDPWAHIGVVDDLEEVDAGLKATYTLDIDTNPVAAQVHRLMKRRSLKEHSFGYEIRDERIAKDGANELLDLDLIEIGPTLKGMNPSTELLAVKSALEEVADVEVKAGRRISRATESALAAAADEAEALAGKIRDLLSAGDSEKQDDEEEDTVKSIGEEDAPSGNSTADDVDGNSDPDSDLLTFKTRIESMRN
jgi:uncharacterized protein